MIRTREQWLEIYAGVPASGHRVKPEQFWRGGEALVGTLKRHGAVRPGALALDLGCGPCKVPPHLVEREGMRFVGVDCNCESIEFCRSLFPGERFEWLDVRNDTYNPGGAIEPDRVRLPVEDESCHLVICASFFTHVGTPKIARHYIDEIVRVLAKGGYFYSTWFRDPPWEASSADAMTVFTEAEIINLLKPFTVISTAGGLVGGESRSQWNVLARKASP
jgi:SAM-dependent methyltransferase